MRAFLLLVSLGLLILPGCGKGEYDRRLDDSISKAGVLSNSDDEATVTPEESFKLLVEKNCLFFDPATGVVSMDLAAAKSANKVTQFDENASYDVVLDGSVLNDADTASLVNLGSQITGVTLAGGFGDDAMKNLLRLRGLTWINLLETNITDRGLVTLGDASNVRSFRLVDNSSITGDSIVSVLALENLKQLYLAGPFTDAELEELGFNQYIELIEIKLGEEVTQAVIDYLKQEMPDTTITAR